MQSTKLPVCAGRCTSWQVAIPRLNAVSPVVHKPHILLPSPAPQRAGERVGNARPLSTPPAGQPAGLNLPMDRDLDEQLPAFDSIASALQDLAAGKFLVVLDDEDRENEGDLIISADRVTTADMAFMVEYTSGVICVGMEGKDLDRLKLPLMVSSKENEEAMYTAFTVTVDLKEGIATGISAEDRAKTLRRLADPTADAADFVRPGHIFPLRYRPGGVIVRPGHTEASVDLARLAGCYPAGVLCEIVNKQDGSMQRTPQLLQFAKQHGLKCITIADLIRYRLRHEKLVQHTSSAQVDSKHGPITVHTFKSLIDGAEHLAFVYGNVAQQEGVLTRIQQESTVSDLLGSRPSSHAEASTSAPSLDCALQGIAAAGQGVVVYLKGQTARGISLSEEVQAISSGASSTYTADLRDYGVTTQILQALSVPSIRLLSPDATQLKAMKSCGVKVLDVVQSGGSAANGHAVMNGKAASPLAAARS